MIDKHKVEKLDPDALRHCVIDCDPLSEDEMKEIDRKIKEGDYKTVYYTHGDRNGLVCVK